MEINSHKNRQFPPVFSVSAGSAGAAYPPPLLENSGLQEILKESTEEPLLFAICFY